MFETVKLEHDGETVEYVRKDSVSPTVIEVDPGSSLASAAVGMRVLVRSRNEGINCGVVEAADETGVILRDARRLWYHRPADSNSCWYEGVAVSGIDPEGDSEVSVTVPRKFIIEDYSLTECCDEAFESIMSMVPHAQN